MELPSSSWLYGKSMGAGAVGVKGPGPQLPIWQLHCWTVQLSCPKAACPIESCSDLDQWLFPSRMSHRHCLPYTKLLFISFFQAAELAVVPYSKGIQMGWTGLYVPIRKAFHMLSTATLRQREAVYCWQFSAYRLAQVFNPWNMFGLELQMWGQLF